MDLKVDLRQPVKETLASLEPSHRSAIDGVGSLVGPGRRQYSQWVECECPDDCPRDHQNE